VRVRDIALLLILVGWLALWAFAPADPTHEQARMLDESVARQHGYTPAHSDKSIR
jgi:hypothetical protein